MQHKSDRLDVALPFLMAKNLSQRGIEGNRDYGGRIIRLGYHETRTVVPSLFDGNPSNGRATDGCGQNFPVSLKKSLIRETSPSSKKNRVTPSFS